MYCDSFACSMSKGACEANIRLAIDAIRLVNISGQSIFMLPEHSVNRMIVCGSCPDSGIDRTEAKAAFRSSIDALIQKVEHYDEWDHPMTREERLQTKRDHRLEHADEIAEARDEARVDKRIQQLREANYDPNQTS